MTPAAAPARRRVAALRLAAADAAIVVVLLAASLVPLLGSGPGAGGAAAAEVTTAAGDRRPLDLARDGVTRVPGPLGETVVEVRGGRARIRSSPCPRQTCRHAGWAGAGEGGLLVCVPNGVIVRVAGALPGGVDARAR